jgi:hypothetical protein
VAFGEGETVVLFEEDVDVLVALQFYWGLLGAEW